MIFVWVTCSAGIAKSLPWSLDLAIQQERLAETKTNATRWLLFHAAQGLPNLTQMIRCVYDGCHGAADLLRA